MAKKHIEYTKEQLDYKANQSNPNNDAHKAVMNNRANQMNPNNPVYRSSRKESEKDA